MNELTESTGKSKLLTDDEMDALRSTETKKEWNEVCLSVKAARGGVYPSDWFVRVIQSGLAHEKSSNWAKGGA